MPEPWAQAAARGRVNSLVWSCQNTHPQKWASMHFTCMRWVCMSLSVRVISHRSRELNADSVWHVFCPFSSTNSNRAVSFPVTHGTGRRVMKAATASPMRWGVSPARAAETSPARTPSPPRCPVPAPFLLQLPVVPQWARRGPHPRAAVSVATVDPS